VQYLITSTSMDYHIPPPPHLSRQNPNIYYRPYYTTKIRKPVDHPQTWKICEKRHLQAELGGATVGRERIGGKDPTSQMWVYRLTRGDKKGLGGFILWMTHCRAVLRGSGTDGGIIRKMLIGNKSWEGRVGRKIWLKMTCHLSIFLAL